VVAEFAHGHHSPVAPDGDGALAGQRDDPVHVAQCFIDRPLAQEVGVEREADETAVLGQCAELLIGQSSGVIRERPAECVRHEHGRRVEVERLVEPAVVQMGQVEHEGAVLECPDQLPPGRLEGSGPVVIAAEPVLGLVVPGQRQAAQRMLRPQRVQPVGSDVREVKALRVGQKPRPRIV
jgi:hypothetical protein